MKKFLGITFLVVIILITFLSLSLAQEAEKGGKEHQIFARMGDDRPQPEPILEGTMDRPSGNNCGSYQYKGCQEDYDWVKRNYKNVRECWSCVGGCVTSIPRDDWHHRLNCRNRCGRTVCQPK
ncbi:hypothetical protein [Thermodesulfovibrio hydrogeniphilus]